MTGRAGFVRLRVIVRGRTRMVEGTPAADWCGQSCYMLSLALHILHLMMSKYYEIILEITPINTSIGGWLSHINRFIILYVILYYIIYYILYYIILYYTILYYIIYYLTPLNPLSVR